MAKISNIYCLIFNELPESLLKSINADSIEVAQLHDTLISYYIYYAQTKFEKTLSDFLGDVKLVSLGDHIEPMMWKLTDNINIYAGYDSIEWLNKWHGELGNKVHKCCEEIEIDLNNIDFNVMTDNLYNATKKEYLYYSLLDSWIEINGELTPYEKELVNKIVHKISEITSRDIDEIID